VTDRRIEQLFAEANANNWNRRQIMKRAAGLGISVPAFVAAMMQAGPAFAQDATPGATPVGTPGATPAATPALTFDMSNPLGVDPAAPLNPFIFNGGLGIAYAENVNSIYQQVYPESASTFNFESGQGLGPALQPRFVGGTPPDVIDNSGANNLDQTSLADQGQLSDLGDLMSAVSFDTPDTMFKDTLVPGSMDSGIFDGKQQILYLTYTVTGLWTSGKLMRDNGYTYPKTWDEFMAMCADIKANLPGVAPFVTTGVHTQYMRGFVFDQLVFKNGGLPAIGAIDNLEDNAWNSDPAKAAASAILDLAKNGYILPGFEGLDHTQSQTEWFNGKGVFLPCGSWLENESGVSSLGTVEAVDAFEMTVSPVPSLTATDALPFEAIYASAGENFFVPEQAANKQGGKEWIRMLLSQTGASYFSQATRTLSVVNGAAEGLDAGPGLASQQATIAAAGANTLQSYYGGWYVDLNKATKDAMFQLMTQAISVDEFCQTCQDAADAIKSDSGITKHTRPDYPAQ